MGAHGCDSARFNRAQAARKALIQLVPHASYRVEVVGMARCLMSARWLMPSASRLSSAAPRSLLPQYQPHAGAYGVEEHMGEHMGESREVPVVVLHVQISGADASPLGGDQVAPLSSEQVRRLSLRCCHAAPMLPRVASSLLAPALLPFLSFATPHVTPSLKHTHALMRTHGWAHRCGGHW